MQAGKLRHRVIIQSLSEPQDEYGQEYQSPSTFAEVWASVEPLQGRELFDAQQINANITHKIGMRFVSGIGPKMRIVFLDFYGSPPADRVFDILSVGNVQERRRELVLLCKERLDG